MSADQAGSTQPHGDEKAKAVQREIDRCMGVVDFVSQHASDPWLCRSAAQIGGRVKELERTLETCRGSQGEREFCTGALAVLPAVHEGLRALAQPVHEGLRALAQPVHEGLRALAQHPEIAQILRDEEERGFDPSP